MKSCYNNYIIHGICKYACSHAEHQGEVGAGGELLKVPNASGKAAFWTFCLY